MGLPYIVTFIFFQSRDANPRATAKKKAGGYNDNKEIACTGSIVTCAHIKCSKLKQNKHYAIIITQL